MDAPVQTFGRYDVVRPLGAGGMGEVLLARQAGLPGFERLVVLKKILPHLSMDPEFLERFLDETRVTAALAHGNVVQVYEVGEVGGQYYMAMEWVDGMDLKEVLALLRSRGKRFPEHLALYTLIEVAKGLSYAHTRTDAGGNLLGIVHRDVSPANLLMAYDGQVKLTDFGVAKATMKTSLSLPGTLHGKVFYMSPEQVGGLDCDARSDIFSLGVVAYEMLAGRRPFEGDSDVAVIDAVRRCDPPSLHEAAPWVPASLAAIVEKALARDRDLRWETMEDFQRALRTYMMEAHTIVSARAMADFMAGLKCEASARHVPTPPAGRSVDEIAAALLAGSAAGPGDATPGGAIAGGTRSVVAPASEPHPELHRTVLHPRRLPLLPWILVGFVSLAATGLVSIGLINEDDEVPVVPVIGAVEEDAVPAASDVRAFPQAIPDIMSSPTRVDAVEPSTNGPDGTAAPSRAPATEGNDEATPRRRIVSVRSDPSGAAIFHGDREVGTTPLEYPLPRTGGIRLQARLPGFVPKTILIGPESPAAVTATLEPLATGTLRFRFFPADADTLLDGRPLDHKGNLVDTEVAEGEHVLRIESGERSRTVRFRVRASETTELGTVELPAD